MAVIGIIQDILIIQGKRILSVVIYLIMVWLALVAIHPLANALSHAGLTLMITGGVLYTVGVLFYALEKRIAASHGIFHLFVLAGSACHYFMILFYIA